MRILLAALATLLISLMASADTSSCSLTSEGLFHGAWVKHRIQVNSETVFGANDMGAVVVQLSELREQGLCQ